MNEWKNYSLTKKIALSFLMTMLVLSTPMLAIFMPELLILIDFGGLELTVGFIILNFKPFISKCNQFLQSINIALQILQNSIVNSVLMKPRYYYSHQALSVFILFLSGSVLLSLTIFVPAIYLGGIS